MAAIKKLRADAEGEQGARRRRRRRREKRAEGDRREGAHARQPAGAVEARRDVDGQYRIVSQPPIVIPLRELAADRRRCPPDELQHMIREQFRAYRSTLQNDRRHLLERFQVIDVARKVVGVGSVGTRAFIVLLQGRDQQDPLFLQVKEATTSVLEDHLPKSRYKQPGERVVHGQRMMQAASDIYLGWTKGVEDEPLPVLAPAPRHEGVGRRGVDGARQPRVLRACVRMDAGAGARAVGRPGRDRRVPRQERRVRPVDHRLLRAVRGSERAGLRGVRRGGPLRQIGGDRGHLTTRARCEAWISR